MTTICPPSKSSSSLSIATSTSPKHRPGSPRPNYHHCLPDPTSTNCPTSPYHRPKSPHRPSSPYSRPSSPYSRPTSPYGRPTSPYGRPTSPYGRPTSPYGRPTSPYEGTASTHEWPMSPYEISTSPRHTAGPNTFLNPTHAINSISKVSSNPSKSLQCTVCLKSYHDARILPCFHSFCASCLETSCLQKGDKLDSVYCPICTEVSELTSKGIQGLPKNMYVEHLQELQLSPIPKLVCDLCVRSEIAAVHCEKCNCNLCEFCMEAHKKQRKTSFHKLVDLERVGSNFQTGEIGGVFRMCNRKVGKVRYCDKHSKEELDLYCKNCSIPVCNKCVSEDHDNHSFLLLEEANMQYSEILQGLLVRAKPLATSLTESLKNIDFVISSIQERSQAVSDEIIEFISSHVKALQEHKRLLLLQLDAIKNQKENTLNIQMENLKGILEKISTNCDVANRALDSGTPSIAFNSKTPVASKLEELLTSKHETSPKEDDYIQFYSHVPAYESNGFCMFGMLDSRGPSAANTTAEGEGLHKAQENKTAKFKVIVRDRHKQCRELGGDRIEASMKSINGEVVYMFIKDCKDGSYNVSYTPESVGEHRLSVLIENKHIRGSPFVVTVHPKSKRQHCGIFHCCTFCSSGGKKHIRCGCGGTMPGGYNGCGHGHRGHPGRRHWSCCGNTMKKSECVR